MQIVNKVAPLQRIQLRAKQPCPWVTDELLRVKGLRDRVYKRFRKLGHASIYTKIFAASMSQRTTKTSSVSLKASQQATSTTRNHTGSSTPSSYQ